MIGNVLSKLWFDIDTQGESGQEDTFCSAVSAKLRKKRLPNCGKKVKGVKKIEVVEQVELHPKIKINCGKCNNNTAYYWTQQTRGADEPETRFFKCTKCNHTWREYA